MSKIWNEIRGKRKWQIGIKESNKQNGESKISREDNNIIYIIKIFTQYILCIYLSASWTEWAEPTFFKNRYFFLN